MKCLGTDGVEGEKIMRSFVDGFAKRGREGVKPVEGVQ